MCIIAYSPHSVPPLTEEVLKTCFANNSDGAGFAYYVASEQMWHVQKGFMSWEAFWEAYSAHNFTAETCVVCHFRIGTSGNKDGGNTHPFPITRNADMMRETEFIAESILIHNGVIGSGDGIISDTMVHVRDNVAPLMPFIDEDGIFNILKSLCKTSTNRWFITKGRRLWRFGTWEEDTETGQLFSNASYKALKTVYKSDTTVYTYPNRSNGYGYGYESWRNRGSYNAPTRNNSSVPISNEVKKYSGQFRKNGVFQTDEWIHTVTELARKANNKTVVHEGTVNHTTETPKDGNYVYGFLNEKGKIEWESSFIESQESGFLVCPHCDEDSAFMESPYNVGNALCLTCGCVFDMASGEEFMMDPDINNAYLDNLSKETDDAIAATGEWRD